MGTFRQDILLVEDNPGDARLVELMLGDDYQLVTVERMSDAIQLLDTREFQVAIVDMSLPDGDGIENIARLKATVSDLPIVVLSGRDDEDFALETVKAGAQDYLIKGDIDEWKLSKALTYAVERKRLLEDVVHVAHHDFLTGLANRVLFRHSLVHALQNAQRRNELVAVLYMDLDKFKPINDALGHEIGDKLLIEVGQRLLSQVRGVDTVGRLGGDEFGIVLEGIMHSSDVTLVAQKILNSLLQEMVIEENSLYIGTSIGISIFSSLNVNSEEDATTLIRDADNAMYEAKRAGGNQYKFYTKAMNENAMAELTLDMQLREALEKNEFVLHYQPKINLQSRRLSGCEALIRWDRHGKGLLYPGSFIEQLEQNGLIVDVGQWVLEESCRQHTEWRKSGFNIGKIAVNLSGKQLLQQNFSQTIAEILSKTEVKPECLEVELTENILIENTEMIIKVLSDLREMGVSIAIDDFGTGYSSFSYLKYFIIDTIKIDRSFIKNITKKGVETAITSAITQLSKDLGVHVVAEGVETQEQLDFLLNHYVGDIQGYYFSKPVSAESFRMENESRCPLTL